MPVEDLLKKLKPVLGQEEVDKIWRNYVSVDASLKRLIETDLRLELAKSLEDSFETRQILLEPPPWASAHGKYRLGQVHYGKQPVCPFGFREDEFIQHKLPDDPDPDHLTEEEVEQLLELTQKAGIRWIRNRDKLIFLLMLHAGLRKIEVSNLKWSDVDLKRDLIVLRKTKGQKPRMIGISKTLYAALQDCWDNWRLSDEFVVTNRTGGQLSRPGLDKLGKRYVDKLNHHYKGEKRFHLHSLRSTFATVSFRQACMNPPCDVC